MTVGAVFTPAVRLLFPPVLPRVERNTPVLEFFREAGSILVTVFVLTSMFNVGLTQKPSRILHHLKNWHFLGAMVLTNLIVVPALMVYALDLVPIAEHYRIGLLIFGIAAGAPFLIKLTDTSEHDLALGATVLMVLMVLMVATVAVMPILLPTLVDGVEVAAWPIVSALLQQMILPLILGFAISEFAESFDAVIQPWVARISNIALYGLIVCILIGYVQSLADPELWKALAVGGVVLVLAFFVGFMMGDGTDHLKDVGGLGTAQRGTASALIVATNSFDDPRILVVITMLNTFAVVFLIIAAKRLSRNNEFSPLDDPMMADEPKTRAERNAERAQTSGNIAGSTPAGTVPPTRDKPGF